MVRPMPEPEPCPVCGAPAAFRHAASGMWHVTCTEPWNHMEDRALVVAPTLEDAVRVWNTRGGRPWSR